jgi:hypothetical protein
MKLHRTLSVLVLLALSFAVVSSQQDRRARARRNAKQQPKVTARDIACVFQKSPEEVDSSEVLSAAHSNRTTQEINGYSHDIPIGEALRMMNAELQCYSSWAVLPPLTEAEVVANAVAGADYNDVAWTVEKESAMKKIAAKRIMPKGSLLAAEAGGCDYGRRRREQTCVDGLKIYLFLGLDKNARATEVLGPEQIVLIRKTYFKTYIEK